MPEEEPMIFEEKTLLNDDKEAIRELLEYAASNSPSIEKNMQ